MKRLLTFVSVLALTAGSVFAQRKTDIMDRGLVALPASSGNFVSWHVFGEEYYDVTYNLYRGSTKIASNLKLSSFTDAGGNSTSSYSVAPVVRGVEGEKCPAVQAWSKNYIEIPVAKPTDRNGADASANYTLNDISIGDLNGDGIAEFIVKRKCDIVTDLSNKKCFHQLDCYDIKGNRLWWIDLGPNMLAGADEQWDCVCYDWDEDGKAEVLLRIQDNAYIHYADGTQELIGSADVDTRWNGIEYTSSGNEYLLYLEGATGRPYSIGPSSHPHYMDYPLTRGLDSDWGNGIIGHRSTKHYFGAPFLDGRHASIFLGRGAYTMHKMTALDVDKDTHKLTTRWYWENTKGGSPWFGQGYHNYAIGDVDWDGRDEIIFGSMVIDDNGKGLSTTGLGHGDAQHCSDFDPYRKYEEQFCCNEDQPANNYRNAATSKIYYRLSGSGDDGRGIMANFTNDYPGSVGRSVGSGWVSSTSDKIISELNGDAFIGWGDLNQRIYWDGDLCDEYFDSPGTEGYGAIYKPASKNVSGARWNFPDSKCSNWSKNNPGGIADILGDWREELIMRNGANTAILVYTTNIPTNYRIPTLWHDHQYRNAMVWQSMGYNQPPHKSYFLGELEGITVAPPPYTMTGRVEVANGGTITTVDSHLLICETNDTKIQIADGASPYMVTFNVPSWVQGTAESNITTKNSEIIYDYFTCDVSGGSLAGATRLVKQGDGILNLPKADMNHSGETNIWAGTVNFGGSVKNSPIWLNRFAEMSTPAVAEIKSLKADYASVVRPGNTELGELTVAEDYYMGFGSRLVLDLYSDGFKSDVVKAKKLTIETKNWEYGPEYLSPVIEIVEHMADGAESLEPGKYLIAHADELVGSLKSIRIEGVTKLKTAFVQEENGDIYLELGDVRGASSVVWLGESNVWDYANTANFYLLGDAEKTPDVFVEGDIVNFLDGASKYTATIADGASINPDTINVNASKAYTINGKGAIVSGALVKYGSGTLTMSNDNTYTGGNYIRGGVVKVSSLSNSTQAKGNLGGITSTAAKFVIADSAVLQTTAAVKMGSPIRMEGTKGGVISNSSTFTMEKGITGTVFNKAGAGTFDMQGTISTSSVVVAAGKLQYNTSYERSVTLKGTGALAGNGFLKTPITVAEGAKAEMSAVNRQTSSNVLTGEGQITIYSVSEKGTNYYATRSPLQLNLKQFAGTIVPQSNYAENPVFTFDTNNGSDTWTLDIPEAITVMNSGKTLRVGQVKGKGQLGGTCTFSSAGNPNVNDWQVGNGDDFSFAGGVSSNAKFTKKGAGKMTATGKWTTSGVVKVDEGELHISSTTTLGTGALTVSETAVLSGSHSTTASFTNSSCTVNGTVQVGVTTTSTANAAMNFGAANVTFNEGSKLIMGIGYKADATRNGGGHILTTGKLVMNGDISLYYSSTLTLEVGDSIILWKAGSVSGTPKLQTYVFDELKGLYWDDTDLAKGILRITDQMPPAAIEGTESDDIETLFGEGAISTVDGKYAGKEIDALEQGVYVRRGIKFYKK